MTSVAEIIDLALKDLGIVGEGQTASGTTLADAFATLNQMLALWQVDKLYVYASKTVAATLTGAASYTVGAGGDLNVQRPHKIDAAFWQGGGVDYPVDVLHNLGDYQQAYKAGAGQPHAIRYEPTYPLGTLYPLPSGATGTLILVTRVDLPTYIGTTDDISLPPEYALAVRYNLAEQLSSAFQTPLRPDVAAMAVRAKKILKRNNLSIPRSQMPSNLISGRC